VPYEGVTANMLATSRGDSALAEAGASLASIEENYDSDDDFDEGEIHLVWTYVYTVSCIVLFLTLPLNSQDIINELTRFSIFRTPYSSPRQHRRDREYSLEFVAAVCPNIKTAQLILDR